MRALPVSIMVMLFVLTLLLACYPFYGEALVGAKYDFLLQKLTTIMILAIFAVSLDLLVGVTGLISLAHAAFFGIAGYTLVLVAPQYAAANIWVVLPLSVGAAALAALIIGVLIIRTNGIFFIMATIAFSQIAYYVLHGAPFAGGSDGIYLFSEPELAIAGFQILDLSSRTTQFYLALVSLLVVYFFLRTLLRAPFGRVLLGVNANEARVRALGYNPLYYKLAAFVLAGTIAGYAGFLSAAQFGYIGPGEVSWQLSAHALVMVILGGAGTLFGAILGAFAFEGLHYGFSTLTDHWEIWMGVSVIAVVLLLPGGIAGLILRLSGGTGGEQLAKSRSYSSGIHLLVAWARRRGSRSSTVGVKQKDLPVANEGADHE
ncbi:MAG: branched-chain amino acid ABC transporter permease [Leeuwenhoekiella sp.]|nr:MAG: branched-chain amino acid ABC transporter permease [Leeuwenhoekiella sp.]